MTTWPDERQRAMLAEMGIRVWAPRAAPAAGAAEPAPARAAVRRGGAAAAPAPADAAALPDAASRPGAEVPAPPARSVRPPPAPAPARQAADPAAPELTPRPPSVEAMDWTQLETAVAACRACALWPGRTQTVFGVGSRRADWMVIGEAPGENEDRQGQPFVGQAGKLLDNMLAAIGLSRGADADAAPAHGAPARQGVYIANVLKCRPPRNRNPQPDEIAQCEPYLRRQVALVQPKIILAMGRFAVQSLLRTSEPIGRLRGRVHQYQGVPVIVTYHPAYLLRALPEKAKAWQDLCLALEVADGGAGAP